jgi:acetylornithine deacetylase/succinyl-diaminopimelate desuccinylase family protein
LYNINHDIRQTVLEQVLSNQKQTVEELQQLVRFPTVNPPGNEQDHQEYLAAQLRDLGLDVKMIEAEAGRPNLVAIRKGHGGGRNLLHYAGHADVVGGGDELAWKHDPFSGVVEDGWIFGRGSVDHKGPIAASLGALRAIIQSGIELAGDIVFIVPVDEECGSYVGTKHLLKEGILYGDMGIYASAGFLNQVIISCSGALSFEIKVAGRASHSGYPKSGINAIKNAAKLVIALEEMQFERVNPFWSPEGDDALKPNRTGSISVGQIWGGETMNVIPGACNFRGNRRLIPNETVDEAKQQIESVIEKLSAEDPELNAEIDYLSGVHGINTSSEAEVVKIVEVAISDIGLVPEIGGSSGGFDARWIVEALGIPFVSYGAGWNGPDGRLCLHAPNEGITIDNLMGMTKGYAMIMLRCCGIS